MIIRQFRRADLWAGVFVFLVGLVAVWEGSGYAFGRLNQIGPGFFPVVLGSMAMLLGVAILFERMLISRSEALEDALSDEPAAEDINFRSLAAILAALLTFAILIDRAGLAPAAFAAVLVASLAERELRLVSSFLLAIGLVVLCIAIFVYGLSLPFRIVIW